MNTKLVMTEEVTTALALLQLRIHHALSNGLWKLKSHQSMLQLLINLEMIQTISEIRG